VARRKVRRIVETLKELAARLTPDERAEYEAMARGILDDADRLAIVGYLLKTHFEEEAARGVLDESAAAGDADAVVSPRAYADEGGGSSPAGRAAHPPASGGQRHDAQGGGAAGTGRRRRRRRRGGHGGGPGSPGGRGPGGNPGQAA